MNKLIDRIINFQIIYDVQFFQTKEGLAFTTNDKITLQALYTLESLIDKLNDEEKEELLKECA